MVRPVVWRPPAEPSPAEQAVIKAVRRAKLFVFLRLHRHELFDEGFQAELAAAYADRPKGQPPVPPAQLALATVVQAYTGVSDDEVIEATLMDRRWQLVLDCLGAEEPPFSKGTLVGFRTRVGAGRRDRHGGGTSRGAAAGGLALKAALDADWDDPAARDQALAWVLGLLDQVEAFTAGQFGDAAAVAAVAVACQVRDQDADLTGPAPALRRGVARDRRISVQDGDMRHGRKSRSVLFDGYKRHVLRDLDTGLVPVVGVTPANAPEASVTGAITADLQAAGRQLSELHIDRAYLSSALVRDRGPDLAVFCKAWRVRNTGGRYAKDQFTLDFAAGQLTCPAGVALSFEPGKTVHFPKGTCAACPLRARCTTSSNGHSVSIHPDEALLAELRRRQQTPGRTREAPRTHRGRARPRPRRALARPPRPLPGHPQEPVRPAPRRRRPQPPRHRPPARHRR